MSERFMRSGWIGALLLMAAVPACAPILPAGSSHAPALVLVSIDGLRPDAITPHSAPVLHRLAAEGRTAEARTILPSRTVPSHVSMLTGVPPEVHGVRWNTDRLSREGYVRGSALEILREAGCRTAAFVSKRKLRLLFPPGSVDHAYVPGEGHADPAERVLEEALAYMRFRATDMVFIHLSEPDITGHALGWMSRPYLRAVRRADRAIGILLQALPPGTVLLVTSDHGGSGHSHGSASEEDRRIPWIAYGGEVEEGEIARALRTDDTAATLLGFFGVPVPEHWEGEAVELGAEARCGGRGVRGEGGVATEARG